MWLMVQPDGSAKGVAEAPNVADNSIWRFSQSRGRSAECGRRFNPTVQPNMWQKRQMWLAVHPDGSAKDVTEAPNFAGGSL